MNMFRFRKPVEVPSATEAHKIAESNNERLTKQHEEFKVRQANAANKECERSIAKSISRGSFYTICELETTKVFHEYLRQKGYSFEKGEYGTWDERQEGIYVKW